MIVKCIHCGGPAHKLTPRGATPTTRLPVCSDCDPRTGVPVPRISDSMERALRFVSQVEGCTANSLHQAIWPHGSRAYAYRVVGRLVEANLITRYRRGAAWALYTTGLGRGVLGEARTAA